MRLNLDDGYIDESYGVVRNRLEPLQEMLRDVVERGIIEV